MAKNKNKLAQEDTKDKSLVEKGFILGKTVFFKNLMSKGVSYLGSPGKAAHLVSKAIKKTKDYESFGAMATDFKDAIVALFQMIKDYATGDYREIEFQKVLLIAAGVLYLVMPIDIVPDMIPVIGLMDDISVLAWIIASLSKEIKQYQVWKKTKVIILPKVKD